jgi:hypothetical protein
VSESKEVYCQDDAKTGHKATAKAAVASTPHQAEWVDKLTTALTWVLKTVPERLLITTGAQSIDSRYFNVNGQELATGFWGSPVGLSG